MPARRRARARIRHDDEQSFVSVYDGSTCIGHIAQRGREHVAHAWPSEIDLGTFPTRKSAADAISAAAGQGRRKARRTA
jgi:hypothetical protein